MEYKPEEEKSSTNDDVKSFIIELFKRATLEMDRGLNVDKIETIFKESGDFRIIQFRLNSQRILSQQGLKDISIRIQEDVKSEDRINTLLVEFIKERILKEDQGRNNKQIEEIFNSSVDLQTIIPSRLISEGIISERDYQQIRIQTQKDLQHMASLLSYDPQPSSSDNQSKSAVLQRQPKPTKPMVISTVAQSLPYNRSEMDLTEKIHSWPIDQIAHIVHQAAGKTIPGSNEKVLNHEFMNMVRSLSIKHADLSTIEWDVLDPPESTDIAASVRDKLAVLDNWRTHPDSGRDNVGRPNQLNPPIANAPASLDPQPPKTNITLQNATQSSHPSPVSLNQQTLPKTNTIQETSPTPRPPTVSPQQLRANLAPIPNAPIHMNPPPTPPPRQPSTVLSSPRTTPRSHQKMVSVEIRTSKSPSPAFSKGISLGKSIFRRVITPQQSPVMKNPMLTNPTTPTLARIAPEMMITPDLARVPRSTMGKDEDLVDITASRTKRKAKTDGNSITKKRKTSQQQSTERVDLTGDDIDRAATNQSKPLSTNGKLSSLHMSMAWMRGRITLF
jgi:hypothetical protein